MVNYKVYVDDYFMTCVPDKISASSLCSSLSVFFALEKLPYVAHIEREVIRDA